VFQNKAEDTDAGTAVFPRILLRRIMLVNVDVGLGRKRDLEQ